MCEWESLPHGDPEVTVYHLVQGLFPDAQCGGSQALAGLGPLENLTPWIPAAVGLGWG